MTISTPELRDNLTQAEAEARALRVSGCEYTIAIEPHGAVILGTGSLFAPRAAAASG
jgi:hypothetical protein